ncbi:hypothetical protein GHT07_01485 [Caenimonas koreensis DSM 17982]|uniref:Uncharacterized protein n=1 Tax=Caenimonas koreensis DSM 17982 TaxID=1121255 RepID=A0A844APF4_9BURK|nr:hypothetical protein [Caenimonas koreensis]MRD45935.1 hypothetical protein [Caenimonas koreensis DSM 17982]
MNTLLGFVLRVLLLLAGLVFAASLAIAFVLLVALWIVRSAWARLTGQRAAPFVMRVDPRGGFNSVMKRAPLAGRGTRAPGAADDVTDVEVKPPS